MGLFDDDFYSTRVPQRGWARWLDVLHSRLPLISVAVISSIVGAVLAIVIYSVMTGGDESLPASGPVDWNALAMNGLEIEERTVAAAAKMEPVVVSVINKQKGFDSELYSEKGLGSGVIFAKQGGAAHVFTNHHVIEGSDQIEVVLTNGDRRIAKLVGKDPISDLAVLQIDGKGIAAVAELGDSDSLRIGQTVIAIGNALGLGHSQTFTKGMVSSMNRTVPVSLNQDGIYDWEQEVIQIDAAINQGNSGGDRKSVV